MPRFLNDEDDSLYSDLTAAFEASESGVLTSSNMDTWEPPAREDTTQRDDDTGREPRGGEIGRKPDSSPAAGDESQDARRRDERGRFAQADDKQPNPDGSEAPKPGVAPASDKPQPQDQQAGAAAPEPSLEPPPPGLSGPAAELWKGASEPVRNYIRQAEETFSQITEPLKHVVNAAKEVGVPWDRYVTNLVKGEAALRRDPMYAIEWLASRHGVDLEKLADMAAAKRLGIEVPGQNQNGTPQPNVILQEVQQLKARLDREEQARVAAEQRAQAAREEAFRGEFDAFVKDKADWARVGPAAIAQIKLLRPTMPTASVTQILSKAYEMARWADPVSREELLASQRRAAAEQQRHSRSSRVVSQTSHRSLPPPRGASGGEDMTVDDTVRSAWAELEAR